MYDLGFLASGVGRFYEDMLVPFTFFALRSNPHSFVEIIVRDPARFEAIYSEELVAIREAVGTSFLIRKFQNEKNHHHPSVYRYFEVPEVRGRFTYIIDVDIMLLEDVLPYYLSNWPDKAIPYNNAIRKNSTRMSGVHFVETERYYTPKLIQRQQELYSTQKYMYGGSGNETYLYDLCEHSHGLVSESCRWRPILGVHFSPNRGPGRVMKSFTIPSYYDEFMAIAKEYKSLFEYPGFSQLLHLLTSQFEVSDEYLERSI